MKAEGNVRSKQQSVMVTEYDKNAKEVDQNILFLDDVHKTYQEDMSVEQAERLAKGITVWLFSGELGTSPSVQFQLLD